MSQDTQPSPALRGIGAAEQNWDYQAISSVLAPRGQERQQIFPNLQVGQLTFGVGVDESRKHAGGGLWACAVEDYCAVQGVGNLRPASRQCSMAVSRTLSTSWP